MRPLPYIIGTKSYVDSADAGLGGMVGFEEEPISAAAPAPSHTTSSAYDINDDNDDGSETFDEPHRARVRSSSSGGQGHTHAPPARPVPPRANNYDYDDDEEDVDETFVEDGSIASGGSHQPPPRPKTTGNPLKDMLNAQITNRSGGAPAPVPAKSANNWDDEDDSEDEGPKQKPISAVLNKGAAPAKAPARRASDEFSVASGSQQGGRAAAQKEPEEEEEDDDGDLFADNDDPFKLFGSKPSTFNRVSLSFLQHNNIFLIFTLIVRYRNRTLATPWAICSAPRTSVTTITTLSSVAEEVVAPARPVYPRERRPSRAFSGMRTTSRCSTRWRS